MPDLRFRAVLWDLDGTIADTHHLIHHCLDYTLNAHIGRGMIGKEGFRLLLNDRRFRKVPMYLETPKGEENGKNLDAINLRTLRRLIKDGE